MSDLTETLIRRLSVGGAPATAEEFDALALEVGAPIAAEFIDIPVGECGGKIRVDNPTKPAEPKSEVDTAGNGG